MGVGVGVGVGSRDGDAPATQPASSRGLSAPVDKHASVTIFEWALQGGEQWAQTYGEWTRIDQKKFSCEHGAEEVHIYQLAFPGVMQYVGQGQSVNVTRRMESHRNGNKGCPSVQE